MKLYTFLEENGDRIEEVRAENHDAAVRAANGWINNRPSGSTTVVDSDTDFYSEEAA